MKSVGEAVAEAWGIPKDVAMDAPHISISADREVYIENHKGIISFSDEGIVLASKSGEIVILGTKLSINRMTSELILIEGFIKSVGFN